MLGVRASITFTVPAFGDKVPSLALEEHDLTLSKGRAVTVCTGNDSKA